MASPSLRNRYLLLPDEDFVRDCTVDAFQASGPGGQKRNRKYSAVRLTHNPTGFSAVSTGTRDQHLNKRDAIRKIRMLIAINMRDDKITPDRQIVSITHHDYPIWVSFLFDTLNENGFDIKTSAAQLGLTPSKLTRIMFDDRMVWDIVTAERMKRGLKKLFPPS